MKILVTGGAGFIGEISFTIVKGASGRTGCLPGCALTYAGNHENSEDVRDNTRFTFLKAILPTPQQSTGI
jgi:dTDP-D-glucose 4,6-dehydratase